MSSVTPAPKIISSAQANFSPDNDSSNQEEQGADTILLRLFVKTGEYAYVRPRDILMIESADHLVKIYVSNGKILRKVFRHGTLKDFLASLPRQFIRIGRFCAINSQRLSG